MKMECELCQIRDSERNLLYKDDQVVIALKEKAVLPGQITVFPTEHFTILEMVPEEILRKCSEKANAVSMAVFDSLGSAGTNVVVRNGLGAGQDMPHFAIEVIPRQESDGVNFQWDAMQFAEEELERVASMLSDELKRFEEGVKTVAKPVAKEDSRGNKKENLAPEKENYLLKQARRLP